MKIRNSLIRLLRYYRQNGFGHLVRRVLQYCWQQYINTAVVLWCVDLTAATFDHASCPAHVTVEMYEKDSTEFDKYKSIIIKKRSRYIPQSVIAGQITRYFARGGRIFLIKVDGQLAGFGWSFIGSMPSPAFMPIAANDAILQDGEIFPEYRGRKLNPILLMVMLQSLQRDGIQRVYSEIKVWNAASLRASAKTVFQPMAVGRTYRVFKKNLVIWRSLPEK